MSRDQEHEPTKQSPLLPFAKSGVAPSLFFSVQPEPTSGELAVPDGQPPAVDEQRPWPPPPQRTEPIATQSADPIPQQSPRSQGLVGRDREQLQRLCRHCAVRGGVRVSACSRVPIRTGGCDAPRHGVNRFSATAAAHL